jgi:hypothetical protein
MGRLCPNAVLGCGCPPDSRGTLFETSLGLHRRCSSFLRASYCSTVGFDGLRARCRPNQALAIMRKNADVVHPWTYRSGCRWDCWRRNPRSSWPPERMVDCCPALIRRCSASAVSSELRHSATLLIPSAGSAGQRPFLARFRLLKRTSSRVTRIALWLGKFNPSGRA